MKRIAQLLLSVTLIIISSSSVVLAETKRGIDEIDALIMAHYKMASEKEDMNIWPEDTSVEVFLPLYDEKNSIIAYYLLFGSGEYCVINNNKENPDLIEFGLGGNALINSAIKEGATKIYYINPVNIETNIYILREKQDNGKLLRYSEYYPELSQKNDALAEVLKTERARISGVNIKSGNYNFINWNDMVQSGYAFDNLDNIGITGSSINWAVMSTYDSIATKHCGAVCVTNIAQYFKSEGYNCTESSLWYTFVSVHSYVHDGPVMDVTSGATDYFAYKGYTLNAAGVSSFSLIKSAINADRPIAMLLLASISNWHWILAVGYREYTADSSQYVRIVDGWNNTCNKFYMINSGPLWFFGKSYHL